MKRIWLRKYQSLRSSRRYECPISDIAGARCGLTTVERSAAANTPNCIPRWNNNATTPAGDGLARKPDQWPRVAWRVKRAFPITEVLHPLTFEIIYGRKFVASGEYAYPARAATAGPAINWYGTVPNGAAGVRLIMWPLIAFRRRSDVLARYQRKPTVRLPLIHDDSWLRAQEPTALRLCIAAA